MGKPYETGMAKMAPVPHFLPPDLVAGETTGSTLPDGSGSSLFSCLQQESSSLLFFGYHPSNLSWPVIYLCISLMFCCREAPALLWAVWGHFLSCILHPSPLLVPLSLRTSFLPCRVLRCAEWTTCSQPLVTLENLSHTYFYHVWCTLMFPLPYYLNENDGQYSINWLHNQSTTWGLKNWLTVHTPCRTH